MAVFKAGAALRNVLTPERIPSFIIPSPSKSPLCLLSPCGRRHQPDRHRLLSQDSAENPDYQQHLALPSPAQPYPLRPSPAHAFRLGRLRCTGHTTEKPEVARDTDLSTRAAMSLEHVEKVTTPYGFRAVLAESPCVQRRESLFHKGQRRGLPVVEVTCTDTVFMSSSGDSCQAEESAATRGSALLKMRLGPKALGRQVMRAARRALTPDRGRRTETDH